MSSFSASSGKYLSSIFGTHPGSKTVLVGSSSLRWLKCTFHLEIIFFDCLIDQINDPSL